MSNRILTLTLIIISAASCQTMVRQSHSIVGEWRREGSPPEFGNTFFNPDHTYYIQGDTTTKQETVSVPGWHAGGPMKGTWEIENGRLFISFGDVEPDIPIAYKIHELTRKKLVISFLPTSNDTTQRLTYRRVK